MEYKLLYYVVPSESFHVEDRIFCKDSKYPVYDKYGRSLLVVENGEFNFTNDLMQRAITAWELTVVKLETHEYGLSKEILFKNWKEQLGEEKAILLACNYPIRRVLEMTDEEAVSEVEAIS